ncbi:MAG: GNAT family N-acetyltransferase [Sphingobacteriia bacterium]|nr:GNAT family N-acetyltransferase [Sphingobacteriia bacterium]
MLTKLDYKLLRLATIADAPGIANVHVTGWHETYSNIVDQNYLNDLSYEKSLNFRNHLFEIGNTNTLVALNEEEKIIAFCDFGKKLEHDNQIMTDTQKQKRTEVGEISAIYVLKKYQRQGIGTNLFKEANNFMKENSFIPFIVWALKENKNACKFYESLGGILVEEIKVVIGDKEYDEIGYRFS